MPDSPIKDCLQIVTGYFRLIETGNQNFFNEVYQCDELFYKGHAIND